MEQAGDVARGQMREAFQIKVNATPASGSERRIPDEVAGYLSGNMDRQEYYASYTPDVPIGPPFRSL